MVPIIQRAVRDDIPLDKLADRIVHFFSVPDGQTTISDSYNENSKKGTSHANSIQARKEAVIDSWESFISE